MQKLSKSSGETEPPKQAEVGTQMPNNQQQFENFTVSPELQRLAYLNILDDLQTDQKNIENQRIATFNILEDISDAQNKLQRKFLELEALKNLIQKIGDSLEPHEVMRHITEALSAIFPKATVNCIIASDKSSDSPPDIAPKSLINITVATAKSVIGTVRISSAKQNAFTQKDSDAAAAIVDSATKTIERLQILVASEHSRLSDLLGSMTNGVLMFDGNKNIVIANPILKKIIGKENGDFTLSEFIGFIAENSKTLNLQILIDKALNQQETAHVEEALIGGKIFEIFIAPVRDDQKRVSGGAIILHDITHLKEVDRMKTEFVSIASHQLRTPLTAIKLSVEMLADADTGKLNAGQKDYLNNIQQSAQSMVSLVNDLLNISRLETGKIQLNLKPTDLKEIINKILENISIISAAHNCKINFHAIPDPMPEIITDPDMIRQAIHNLISNAIQYSSSGGNKIDIAINRAEDDGHLIISVKDAGIGIPEDARKRIFEKFFRAENAIKTKVNGTGLGLYIVKMIIENLGGNVWFDSTIGAGTAFYIKIPIKSPPPRLKRIYEYKK